MMQINTHSTIDTSLCGAPTMVEEGRSRVELQTTRQMAVDQRGLVHGGFVFGLADHAAMIAVNDPNVVLGAAQVTFIKPVAAGQTVVADAQVHEAQGRKRVVAVRVTHDSVVVFEGQFTCFVLQQHVLD
jgi:uncharacterized protein (TIGR00369 family)